jgi:DNA-binding GntR family transcriptional regulator
MNYSRSPLCLSLGDTPSLQLISFLLAHRDFDYSKTELAKNLGLSRQTIYKALEPLVNFKLVVESRKIGNTTLYKLNLNSKSVKTIQTFNESIVNLIIKQEKKDYIDEKRNIEDVIDQLKMG